MEPPVEKRDTYSLFFKFYRIIFRQHLDTTIPRTAENMILDSDEISKPDPNHWSHTHRLVQDWRSTKIRLSDFNTFEQFMMHVLEIDLTPSLTYLKKEEFPSSQKQDQQKEGVSKEQMDEAFAEIWKARKEEMTSIFEHYAKLDGVRFERDMMVYNYFLKNQHQYNILMNPPILTAPPDPSPNVKTLATIPFQIPIVPVATTNMNMETIYPLPSSLAHVNNISCNQSNEKSGMKKKIPKKRRGRPVKHPNAPSRPLSAYNLFFRSEYRKMKENDGEVRMWENVTQRVAKCWRVAPDNVKKFFSEEAIKEQARYKKELLEFKKRYGNSKTIEKSMPSST